MTMHGEQGCECGALRSGGVRLRLQSHAVSLDCALQTRTRQRGPRGRASAASRYLPTAMARNHARCALSRWPGDARAVAQCFACNRAAAPRRKRLRGCRRRCDQGTIQLRTVTTVKKKRADGVSVAGSASERNAAKGSLLHIRSWPAPHHYRLVSWGAGDSMQRRLERGGSVAWAELFPAYEWRFRRAAGSF